MGTPVSKGCACVSVGETLASLPPPLLQTSPLLAEPPEPPRFIKEPKDQIGVSGGVASFVCQATGDPKPRVTWNKKGKKVNSQRFEVSTPLYSGAHSSCPAPHSPAPQSSLVCHSVLCVLRQGLPSLTWEESAHSCSTHDQTSARRPMPCNQDGVCGLQAQFHPST